MTIDPFSFVGSPGMAMPFDIKQTKERLEANGGGYEIVHLSPGFEVGVYVLVAPEPDRQQPHDDDELYIVLDGFGVLDVEGEPVPLEVGQAVFVPAGARHGFTAYVQLSVLVIFARRYSVAARPRGVGVPA
jgi:mannose-6-phosphate isomerase-like protein (cupin superfamily)